MVLVDRWWVLIYSELLNSNSCIYRSHLLTWCCHRFQYGWVRFPCKQLSRKYALWTWSSKWCCPGEAPRGEKQCELIDSLYASASSLCFWDTVLLLNQYSCCYYLRNFIDFTLKIFLLLSVLRIFILVVDIGFSMNFMTGPLTALFDVAFLFLFFPSFLSFFCVWHDGELHVC